ncbi:MAG: hypothetical protein Q8M95_14105 [Candidatus Methanoperedens sp.]|nr:hypothetical protein [Candidatus Methanoperedens sp.]
MKKIALIIIILSLIVAGCTDRSGDVESQEKHDIKTYFSPECD